MAIRNKKYIVRLDQEERESLRSLVRVGKAAARKITRARMLLKADAGTGGPGWTDERIAETLEVGAGLPDRWPHSGNGPSHEERDAYHRHVAC